jgi:hypothetical protein
MRKPPAFMIFSLLALVAIEAGGCAFIHYDKGAGPPADPALQAPQAAAPANGQQTALASLAARVGGPGGGWIIAATPDHIQQHSLGSAQQANRLAQQQPAGPGDIERSDNCDLNADGYVTMDEVLALKRAGLTDEQLISRVRRTPMVFAMTDRQQQYLHDRGIPQAVLNVMLSSNGEPGRNS